MKREKIYHFETYTAAKDAANLYYISSPAATSITDDRESKELQVLTRLHPVAVFRWG